MKNTPPFAPDPELIANAEGNRRILRSDRRAAERYLSGGLTVAPRPHYCRPPEIYTWDLSKRALEEGPPTFTRVLHPGTTFDCDCGQRHIVWDKPSVPGMVNGLEWRTETRWEQRKRRWLK